MSMKRLAAVLPPILSLLASGLVLVAVTTGWERNLKDEGAAAHLFQILIVLQVPLIVAFLVSADWKAYRHVLNVLLLQIAALALPLGLVAYFRL